MVIYACKATNILTKDETEINMSTRYEFAKQKFAEIGVDTEKAISALLGKAISLHCWQGDDVKGFDSDSALSGGIQVTGNYPGAARTPEELMADLDLALSLVPGTHRINIHACYAIFEDGEFADRDALEPKHFKKWVEYAKERGLGIDFNPTFFAHPKANGLTLSSPDDEIREFWIRHGIACIKISEYFARELGTPCMMNIWIPDGMKDTPADRLSPRRRFKESLDKILACGYDRDLVTVALESKVFGIGAESYTVGSAEFTLSYAAKNGIISLMDNGHYHPTEVVSDKLSSMLLFDEKIALHVTRGVRWDSDHVVIFDDETKEIAKEIVRCNALDRVLIGLDYFDGSINRIAAWVIGMRSFQKALLNALLQPAEKLAKLQEEGRFTELLMLQEELKFYPVSDVWEEVCRRCGIHAGEKWFDIVSKYEKEVQFKRV